MKLLSIKKSDKAEKKYVATFCKCPGETKCPMSERKKVYFGQAGMDDYTLTKDKEQRERYRKRHAKDKDQRERYRSRHAKEKDQDADTPGALAFHILWGNSTSIRENIRLFKEKYKV